MVQVVPGKACIYKQLTQLQLKTQQTKKRTKKSFNEKMKSELITVPRGKLGNLFHNLDM